LSQAGKSTRLTIIPVLKVCRHFGISINLWLQHHIPVSVGKNYFRQHIDQTAHQISCPCMLVVLQKEKGNKETVPD
jgi:hypothetical protein